MDLDRRFDRRIPLEAYLTAYLHDRSQRGFSVDISERGLYLQTLIQEPQPPRTPVGIELRLPGMPETIWAGGETCRDHIDDYFYGLGIRFVAMASRHERMLRDYCLGLRHERPSPLSEFCQRLRHARSDLYLA